MNYIEALTILHKEIAPVNYLEIGCRQGISLGLAGCQSIAIDPDFEIKTQLSAPTRIFKMTSDAFFQNYDPGQLLDGAIHLAFIDGMHDAAFALRDFINIEKNSDEGSMVVIDDVLPERMEWATRVRKTKEWTGDVYKIIAVLGEYRPDLRIHILDIEMKGMAIITKLNPASNELNRQYATIEQDLLAGKYDQTTTASLREQLKPLPAGALQNIVQEYKNERRATPAFNPDQVAPQQMYLDLLKASILNEVYLDNELRLLYLRWCLEGVRNFDPAAFHDVRPHLSEEFEKLKEQKMIGQFYDRKIKNAGFAHSMMGRKRMDNLEHCLIKIKQEGIAGDLIECGVWRGGGTIFMAGFAMVNGWADRKIFVADSFEGLPVPALAEDENLDLSKNIYPELAIDLQTVQDNFSKYGLLSGQVVFLKGWFKDTLSDGRLGQLALLRLDGDLYESTMDALVHLYDKVQTGGFIIVDDFGIINCEKAVRDFFDARGEAMPSFTRIDWTGIYWRKDSSPRI